MPLHLLRVEAGEFFGAGLPLGLGGGAGLRYVLLETGALGLGLLALALPCVLREVEFGEAVEEVVALVLHGSQALLGHAAVLFEAAVRGKGLVEASFGIGGAARGGVAGGYEALAGEGEGVELGAVLGELEGSLLGGLLGGLALGAELLAGRGEGLGLLFRCAQRVAEPRDLGVALRGIGGTGLEGLGAGGVAGSGGLHEGRLDAGEGCGGGVALRLKRLVGLNGSLHGGAEGLGLCGSGVAGSGRVGEGGLCVFEGLALRVEVAGEGLLAGLRLLLLLVVAGARLVALGLERPVGGLRRLGAGGEGVALALKGVEALALGRVLGERLVQALLHGRLPGEGGLVRLVRPCELGGGVGERLGGGLLLPGAQGLNVLAKRLHVRRGGVALGNGLLVGLAQGVVVGLEDAQGVGVGGGDVGLGVALGVELLLQHARGGGGGGVLVAGLVALGVGGGERGLGGVEARLEGFEGHGETLHVLCLHGGSARGLVLFGAGVALLLGEGDEALAQGLVGLGEGGVALLQGNMLVGERGAGLGGVHARGVGGGVLVHTRGLLGEGGLRGREAGFEFGHAHVGGGRRGTGRRDSGLYRFELDEGGFVLGGQFAEALREGVALLGEEGEAFVEGVVAVKEGGVGGALGQTGAPLGLALGENGAFLLELLDGARMLVVAVGHGCVHARHGLVALGGKAGNGLLHVGRRRLNRHVLRLLAHLVHLGVLLFEGHAERFERVAKGRLLVVVVVQHRAQRVPVAHDGVVAGLQGGVVVRLRAVGAARHEGGLGAAARGLGVGEGVLQPLALVRERHQVEACIAERRERAAELSEALVELHLQGRVGRLGAALGEGLADRLHGVRQAGERHGEGAGGAVARNAGDARAVRGGHGPVLQRRLHELALLVEVAGTEEVVARRRADRDEDQADEDEQGEGDHCDGRLGGTAPGEGRRAMKQRTCGDTREAPGRRLPHVISVQMGGGVNLRTFVALPFLLPFRVFVFRTFGHRLRPTRLRPPACAPPASCCPRPWPWCSPQAPDWPRAATAPAPPPRPWWRRAAATPRRTSAMPRARRATATCRRRTPARATDARSAASPRLPPPSASTARA